ncbi:phage portal protein family protein [Magnetococcus sp. PR-3]|uniref:phage portal protein family protein n=1 Tax=Magnetococcus sp. PR-3 TaxID=3120355 RepID=UPI002FCDF814
MSNITGTLHGYKPPKLDSPQTARVAPEVSSWEETIPSNLTPHHLASLLKAAEGGDLVAQANLWDAMEDRWPHLQSEIEKREGMISSAEWVLVPPADASDAERQAATTTEAQIRALDDQEDLPLGMMSAVGRGFAPMEIVWGLDAKGYHRPTRITRRAQQLFQVHAHGVEQSLRLRHKDKSEGVALRQLNWIIHRHSSKPRGLTRGGLYRPLALFFVLAHMTLRDLSEFLEIYGIPVKLGVHPGNASKEQVAALLRAIRAIGRMAAGTIPSTMDVRFEEAAKGSADPFTAMWELCNKEASKLILGGTLTSQADGKSSTNALGQVHNEVRHDLALRDGRQIGSTLTAQLVRPMVALNFGIAPERAPRWVWKWPKKIDVGKVATGLTQASKLAPVPLAHFYGATGIPEPKDGEPVIYLPPQTGGQQTNSKQTEKQTQTTLAAEQGCDCCTTTALTAGDPAPEEDWEADLETALEGDWQAVNRELVGTPLAAMEGAGSFEQATAALDALMQSMPADQQTQWLATATLTARGLGEDDEDHGDEDAQD